MGVVDDRIAELDPVPWTDAEEGDVVAGFLCHVVAGRYAPSGEFQLTLSIPSEVLNPHDLMKSLGSMSYVEVLKA